MKRTANRTITKRVRFTPEEAADLASKAEACGLTQSMLIRQLIKGYRPKEKPDEEFYKVLRELHSIGNNINQLAAKANSMEFIDATMLEAERQRWQNFILEIEQRFIKPERDEKWQ